jgi:hypothetical protein
MLYNESTGKPKVQTDVLSLESLIAWLERHPPMTFYNFNDCDGMCLYGQYMAANGIMWRESGATGNTDVPAGREDFCILVYQYVARQRPWTFGAALERARAAVS